MKVQLIAHTNHPERVVATAAKLCYSNDDSDKIYDKLSGDQIQKFVAKLMEMGHESPLEHASFTFRISGISRSCMAQLTRHRIASFSVQSQRYVNYTDKPPEPVTPSVLIKDPGLQRIFDRAVKDSFTAYADLSTKLQERGYKEKEAIEVARAVLPNAWPTNLIVTMNARELLHFFKLRCCERAQAEIRDLAWHMLYLCKIAAPAIFADAGPECIRSGCHEGKLSCGYPYKNNTKEKDHD